MSLHASCQRSGPDRGTGIAEVVDAAALISRRLAGAAAEAYLFRLGTNLVVTVDPFERGRIPTGVIPHTKEPSPATTPRRVEYSRCFIPLVEIGDCPRFRKADMALDVLIGPLTAPRSGPSTSFEPEAYYWFLHPLIERLAETTGRYIDLYGTAEFSSGEIDMVDEFLDDAEELVRAQPASWDVHMGTRFRGFSPVGTEILETVERVAFLAFLGQLRQIAKHSKELGAPMVFFGD